MRQRKLFIILSIIFLLSNLVYAQEDSVRNIINLNYYSPSEYEIGDIRITGADHLDHPSVILLTGLSVGKKINIPSDDITTAIDKLWRQGIFEDIEIKVDNIIGKTIMLNIH